MVLSTIKREPWWFSYEIEHFSKKHLEKMVFEVTTLTIPVGPIQDTEDQVTNQER